MRLAIGLTISTVLVAVGLCKIAWPAALVDEKSGDPGAPPTDADISGSRFGGIVMFVFGVIGWIAILTSDGTPPEFIGV